MHCPSKRKPKKQIPIRVDFDDWNLLHEATEEGGIQREVMAWIEPHLQRLRDERRQRDEACRGK